MTIDINQFWNLLSETQLVPVSQIQALFTKYSAESSLAKSPETLQRWLVEQNAITDYQASIIAAGHSGPFRYGNYTIVQRLENGVLAGSFAGQHTKTGYSVFLQFLPGSAPEHLKLWHQIEALVEKLSEIKHANVPETFEAVTLPNHRFVVSQLPKGSPVSEKLPRKARLPWQKACAVIAQAARGLEPIHQTGIVHNSVSPRTIWLEKSGRVQLRLNPLPDPKFDIPDPDEKGTECKFDYASPESIESPNQISPSSDVYSLGCSLYRIISGRTPFPESDLEKKKQQQISDSPASLSKYELPKELESLLQKMMAKDPSTRPATSEAANLLGLLSGKADEINAAQYAPSKSRLAYLNSIKQFLPRNDQADVATVPEISTRGVASPDGQNVDPEIQAARAAKIEAAAKAAQNRKKSQWKVPAAIGGALTALSLILVVFAYFANQTVVEKPTDPDPKSPTKVITENVDGVQTPNTDLASLPPELRPTVLQEIIDDDDSSLWESPTNGPPIQFSYLPITPKLLFVFRLSEMAQQAEGQRLLQSFGPEFGSRIEFFKNISGLDLENIEELVISLHTNKEFEYEPYFVVRTKQPIDVDRMMQNWNRPALRQLENQQEIYESKDGSTAYYILFDNAKNTQQESPAESAPDQNESDESATSESPADTSDRDKITRFAFGSKELVEQVALSAGANVLSGSLRKMADWTDQNRHMNVLFLRNALFNDEGQKLMGENLRTFNRELGIAIPDDVRGGLLSLHIDAGNYVELMLDKNIDLKAVDLRQQMADESRARRDMLMNFVASIPSSPYWDKVRIRYGGMLANFYQNLRWDVEHGEVVANCWLPPMAAHNLIASSELVISFSSGASSADAAPAKTGPKTLKELLAIKRDLNIANPPDLNVLMSDLKAEIEDDLGKMPFAFNIRLLGSDLEAKGITKNQRPSELSFNQKSLAEILTSVMTLANPSKDITGPSDPDCELVWVVAEDPESPGEKAILITTRTAATEKSYELPEAFRTE